MVRLKGIFAFLLVSLLLVIGVQSLQAIEIDYIAGRPWDSGKVDINGHPNQRPRFKKDPSYRITTGNYLNSKNSAKEQSLEGIIMEAFSFLKY